MKVIKWLEKVQQLDNQINNLIEERDELWAIATDTGARLPDGMPFDNTNMVSQKMQDATIAKIEIEHQLDRVIDEFIDHKRQVVNALNMHLPEFERGILYRHYIKYEPWSQIADDMGYCRMQLWRIRQGAYHILGKALDMLL